MLNFFMGLITGIVITFAIFMFITMYDRLK